MGLVIADKENRAIKYLTANPADSGANTLLAGITGKKIRVLAMQAQAITAVSMNLESGTTDISGIIALGATGGVTLPMSNPYGWCETAEGAALNCTLSGAVAVGVTIVYMEV